MADFPSLVKGAIDATQEWWNGGQAPSTTGSAPGDDLAQSDYDFRYTVFPADLGMDDVGHYMIININVPTKGIKTDGLQLGTPAGSFTQFITPLNQVSKLDNLRYGLNVTGGQQRPGVAIPRNSRRIAESIALHMPAQIVHTNQNEYDDIELTALAGKLTVGAANLFGRRAGNLVGGAIDNATQASRLGQTPINPMVEITYANTVQRQYVFEVLLAPRNEYESKTIKTLIQTLRFHAAPEINENTFGFTWIPPADFDITFYNKGVENLNILRINTCVLARIDVDYAPQGVYSTFRNGHPVAVRLSMGFRELEPIHKQRVLQGF
jgi:hypothetical protein